MLIKTPSIPLAICSGLNCVLVEFNPFKLFSCHFIITATNHIYCSPDVGRDCTPYRTLTCDTGFRKPLLYTTELMGHKIFLSWGQDSNLRGLSPLGYKASAFNHSATPANIHCFTSVVQRIKPHSSRELFGGFQTHHQFPQTRAYISSQ